MTTEKLSNDERFLAFHLQRYRALKNLSEEALQHELGCTDENYYKLCLSRLPENNATDRESRLAGIVEFAKADVNALKALLSSIGIEQPAPLRTLEQSLFPSLTSLPLFNQPVQSGQKIIRFPERTRRAVFKAAAAVFILLSLVRIQMAKVDESALRSASTDFRDSLSHLAIQDNTAVHPPFIQHT